MIKNWRWFISKTLRETIEDRHQVTKMLAAQRDLINTKKIAKLEQVLDDLDTLCRGPIDKEALQTGREKALQIADDVLIPYPDPKYRDWVEMFLVVAALVLAFRTFFFQPFKIPTGSMQPTLYGITSVDLFNDDTQAVPGKAGRVLDWFRGETWYHMKAEGHWKLIDVSPPTKVRLTKPYGSIKLTFEDLDNPGSPNIKRTVWYTWFDNPPYKNDHSGQQPGNQQTFIEAMIKSGEFENGDDIFKFKMITGDHLFVNRVTYNFRHPRRGDIAVFNIKTADVTHPLSFPDTELPTNDTFYIKRLVALGEEKVAIGADRHLIINERRLTSADPGFEFIYSLPKDSRQFPIHPVLNSVYSGHEPVRLFLNNEVFKFTDKLGKSIANVPKDYYLMFGDNTFSSSDSRFWGAIPKKNVIGISSFVYWPPLSPRFGWSHR
jgi:signal peptidase I